MGVLIVALVMVGGQLVSEDLRFVVGIITGLTLVGVLVYYVMEARKMMRPRANPSPSHTSQNVTASGGSTAKNISQQSTSSEAVNQGVRATGGSTASGITQTASSTPSVNQTVNAEGQSTITDVNQTTAPSKEQ